MGFSRVHTSADGTQRQHAFQPLLTRASLYRQSRTDEDEAPDYLNDQENYWNTDDLKVVYFSLNNDQIYLAKVPKNVELKEFYGVMVKDYTYEGE